MSKFIHHIKDSFELIKEDGSRYWFEDELADYVYNQDSQISSNAIAELHRMYPNKKRQVVYRGLFFDSKRHLDNFLDRQKNKYTIKSGYTSWTRSRRTAEIFATTVPISDMAFMSRDFARAEDRRRRKRDWTTGYGVMMAMVLPKGKAIDVNLTKFAKEDELLVLPGTYATKIVEIFRPHEEAIQDIPDINVWVQNQRGMGNRRGKMEFTMMDYILQNHPEDLNKKSKRHLFNLFSGSLPSVRFELIKDEMIHLNPFPKMPKERDLGSKDYTWSDLDKRKQQDKRRADSGKKPLKVSSNDYGSEELSVFIKVINFNYNLIYFSPILLPSDMKKLTGILNDRFEILYFKLIQLKQDYPDTILRFPRFDLGKFRPFMSPLLFKKINGIVGERLRKTYQSMSSVETTKWINSLSGEAQRNAIEQMVRNLDKLFNN